MGEDGAHGWIRVDETAKKMLSRVLKDHVFLLLPPLHRVPLRAGNVVEITGASPTAKTQVLIQTAISCILPKTWNGIHYGGLGKLALFLDIDCRFDVLRLSEMLKHRLVEANRLGNGAWWQLEESHVKTGRSAQDKSSNIVYDEELYVSCMKRFLYLRCYDSLQLLSILKTLHYRIRQHEACGTQVGVLMIDRKTLSLTNVVETIVQEMKKLLQVHSLVVTATKATIYEEKHPTYEENRKCFPVLRLAPGLVELSSMSKDKKSNSLSTIGGGATTTVLTPREFTTMWPITSINGSNANLIGFEKLLTSVLGPKAQEKGSIKVLKADVAAQTFMKIGFGVERKLRESDLEGLHLPAWRTKPETMRMHFEVLAKVDGDKVIPENVMRVDPIPAEDTIAQNVITGNVTMSRLPIIQPLPSPFTL